MDTNVLVYAYDAHEPEKRRVAQERLARLWASRSGALSVQVLSEFVVTVTGKWRDRVDVVDARAIVETLEAWDPYRPSGRDVLEAIDIASRRSLSFWDALILVATLRSGADVLLTEDLSHGHEIEGVRIENPFA